MGGEKSTACDGVRFLSKSSIIHVSLGNVVSLLVRKAGKIT